MENNNQKQQQAAAAAADKLTPQERLRGLYTEFAISQRQKKCFGVASSSWCCGLLDHCTKPTTSCCNDHNDDNEHGLGMLDNEGLEWARDAANKQKDFFMFKANYMLRRKGINSLQYFGGDESELRSAQCALDASCNAGKGPSHTYGRNTVEQKNWQEYYAYDQYIKSWLYLEFMLLILLVSCNATTKAFIMLSIGCIYDYEVSVVVGFVSAVVLIIHYKIKN